MLEVVKTFVAILGYFCTKKRPQIYSLTGGLPKEEKKKQAERYLWARFSAKNKVSVLKTFQETYPRRNFEDRRDAGGGSILRTPPPMSRIGLVTVDELNGKQIIL